MSDLSHIPPGYHSVTPSLNLKGAEKALAFYKAAFDAEERFLWKGKDGSVQHGEFTIGNSAFMFCDEDEAWGALSPETVGGCPVSLNIHVADCDAAHAQAVAAGANSLTPPTTYPWGERSAMLLDPFGFRWSLMQHIEDVSPEELERRMAELEGE